MIRQAGSIPTISDPSIFEDLTEWERQREEEEFARVTLLFRKRESDALFDERFTRGDQDASGLLFPKSARDVRPVCSYFCDKNMTTYVRIFVCACVSDCVCLCGRLYVHICVHVCVEGGGGSVSLSEVRCANVGLDSYSVMYF